MAAIAILGPGRSIHLFVVFISVIVFCSTPPSLGQDQDQGQGQGQGQGQDQGQGQPNQTLTHFNQTRQNRSQSQGQGRQVILPDIWANPLDQQTCHYHWNIPFTGKCEDPNSPAYFAKTSAILKKYNVDEISFIVDNDADKPFPLAADRELSRLNCGGRPLETFCQRGQCLCLEDPCEENILPTAITLAECDHLVYGDAGTPPPDPELQTTPTTADPEVLGIGNGTGTPSPRRGQPQGQLVIQTSFSVTVSLFAAAAVFGAGAGAA